MLKLRKVELLGFKSFCEKTTITFSGGGITCIVGPNGCGKSNVVDAISWVLGEQSHKMLRAERMSDCIFNGTAKRPPLGLAEVTLTLVDPGLAEAAARVLEGPHIVSEVESEIGAPGDALQAAVGQENAELESEAAGEEFTGKRKRKRAAEKPAITLKPGEVVVARRLYRSGQSEYLINSRVARLRDVQEIFMGIGLGPDSYAIIEQGRIGQILNSRPMDRRAIIEEAAGVTMYKTKRRLAEAKLEASRVNLSRVNDILVEVEKQLASLKRQASKARRYAEIRGQMRGMLKSILASRAEHLDIEAARLEKLLREMGATEERQSRSVHELESEQERLTTRTYALDSELRQIHSLLGQAALELDRTENRIAFNREQVAQFDENASRISFELDQAQSHASDFAARLDKQRGAVSALRDQVTSLDASLRNSAESAAAGSSEQTRLELRIEELRRLAGRLAEDSARQEAEALQAEEIAASHAVAEQQRIAGMASVEGNVAIFEQQARAAELSFRAAETRSQELAAAVAQAQARLAELRQSHQENSHRLESLRQSLSAERARYASIEKILSERAYTADAVQKLFELNGHVGSRGFRAVGLLADYADVREEYEGAVEQFLRDELEYVVVESFDHARAGVSLLRDDMGGRATFFVDSLKSLNLHLPEEHESPLAPGVLARLDQLIEFRDPLGPAAKVFLPKLRSAYLVEDGAIAEQASRQNPQTWYLTPDGTCYHGRMVSGGRRSEAGPLVLKRELRQHEAETARLEHVVQEQQTSLGTLEASIASDEEHLTAATTQHFEAEKALVSAQHRLEQARGEFARVSSALAAEREEIARLRDAAQTSRLRAQEARKEHEEAVRSRAAAETEAGEAGARLVTLRDDLQALQERLAAGRAQLATLSERLSAAEGDEKRLSAEIFQANERAGSLEQQRLALESQKAEMEASCEQLAHQAESLRTEKARLEERKLSLEKEWEESRSRFGQLDETLRGQRQSLEAVRAERNQRQIEKARNDADRDYLRQTCVAELNAQPEELMAQSPQLLVGEELVAAETSYNEMKARVEAMGPVNMMAFEEFQECEQREAFLRRERDDLVQSIQNTQLTINELDQVSRQKFEEAFNAINSHFAVAFQSLFGGGHGEMRLTEPDSSGESGIDIAAQPPGKRLQNILLLSGGEKALTALALLIAVFKYQPSPFCILDEVDAPLDEANVGRFNKMLEEMGGQTQFIVVTHNRRTMEMGSVLYGVTMQEPGVSKLVSVKWEEAAATTQPKAASAA
ncbi:MAG TPA: chromosome segregation protein SMC [Candidatus Acidoferrales bacterium]|nr:chromosome segregation protein SMC [Candidatus Acidoferrales bacterium]